MVDASRPRSRAPLSLTDLSIRSLLVAALGFSAALWALIVLVL